METTTLHRFSSSLFQNLTQGPFYIRVYDPEVGGAIDAKHGGTYDSRFRYTIFGGNGCYSDPANQSVNPGF